MLLTIVLAADAALDAGSVASHHNRQWVLSSTAQPEFSIHQINTTSHKRSAARTARLLNGR